MLVLCMFTAEGHEQLYARLPILAKEKTSFTGALMINCRSSNDVPKAFAWAMHAAVQVWRGPVRPIEWQLVSYLPANGQKRFGVQGMVRFTTEVAAPIAEPVIKSTIAIDRAVDA